MRRSNGDSRAMSVSVEGADDTVGDVLGRLWVELRAQGVDERYKQVRMIYAGKLLTPNSALASTFNLTPECFVHFVVTDAPSQQERPDSGGGSGLRQLVGSVGAFFFSPQTGSSSASAISAIDAPSARGQRGLDILQATHNLTSDEVQSLRAIFADDIAAFARGMRVSGAPPADGAGASEVDAATLHQAETVWLLHQGVNSEFMANLPVRATTTAPRATSAGTGEDDLTIRQGQRARSRLLARLRRTGTADYSPGNPVPGDEGGPSDEGSQDEDEDGRIATPGQTGLGSRSLLGMLMTGGRHGGQSGAYAPVNNTDIETGLGGSGPGAQAAAPGEEQQRGGQPRSALLPPVGSSNLGGSASGEPVPGFIQGLDEIGTARDWFWGVMLGFSFGTLMLLCVFERSVNYRNKLGIISGVLLQLTLASFAKESLMGDA